METPRPSQSSETSALQALEWQRFIGFAQLEARTETAKARLGALLSSQGWARDIATARVYQQETQEVTSLLDRDGLWGPLAELQDPATALDLLGRNAVLETAQLALLRRWLYAVDSWTQIPREEIRGERFRKMLASLPEPFEPLRVLDRVLTPEGELSERASPKLASLHSEIRSVRKEIGAVLDHLVKTFSSKGVLQENFSDVRDGRYVIPVKISHQNEVDGIIYEASASRQTVFVEPKEVASLNNRLRRLQNDLVQEIYEVLKATSERLAPFGGEIASSVEILTHWDAVQAKARLGLHYGGKPVTVSEERSFRLSQTAHPLLFWSLPNQQIIRNEIDFGDPIRSLLITGPNTGGKTVLLKTLGLAGLCARTGFPFPGTDHPTVPFFDSFFADLGDSQSIEQHLSTFAGHCLRFKEILHSVTDQSLVLIDELNTATDPEEGAALGRAFLETVMARGALIVTTTHDPHLKGLAVSDPRILNASMAFDEASRSPTYRMVLGVPGRSRALETAARLGIPENVLQLARSYLTREHIEFESLLARLESDSQEAARARREAVHLREEAEKLRQEWTERTQSTTGEMLERTRQRLRRILEQAQDEVRASVRRIDELKSRRELDQARSQLNESFSQAAGRIESALHEEAPELAEALNLTLKAEPAEAPRFVVGMMVRIPKWKATGEILELHGNKAKVAMGSIQMSLSIQDIDTISSTEAAAAKKSSLAVAQKRTGTKIIDVDRPSAPPNRIDLRGRRFDQAMSELEHYLDQAFRSGALAEVTIVHGLGSGALREGARKLLGELPYVKEYRDGGVGMGGAGATIVEFDR